MNPIQSHEQRSFHILVREKDLKMQVGVDGCCTTDFKMKGRSHGLSHEQGFKTYQGKGTDFFQLLLIS